jgi:hypothetical protein
MPDAILAPFPRFSKEASAVGRLLSGYSTLELTLMNSVHMGRGGDLNAVLKSMFCIRGESRRIAKAETLGGPAYDALGLGAEFRRAIGEPPALAIKGEGSASWCSPFNLPGN